MKPALEMAVREMREGDRGLVIKSWLTSYADSSEVRFFCRFVLTNRRPYFEAYGPHVEALVTRSQVRVATLPENDDAILGWAAVEGAVLHYVFVKPRWRRLGVASRLLDDMRGRVVEFSHRTPDMKDRTPEAWAYRPQRRFE